jgi:hypothetical protein
MTGGMEFDDKDVLTRISDYSGIKLYDKIIQTISIIDEVPDEFNKRMEEKIKEYTSWITLPNDQTNYLSTSINSLNYISNKILPKLLNDVEKYNYRNYQLYLCNDPSNDPSEIDYNYIQVKYYMRNLFLSIEEMITKEKVKHNFNYEALLKFKPETFLHMVQQVINKYRSKNINAYKENKIKLLKLLYNEVITRYKVDITEPDSDKRTKKIAVRLQYKKLLEDKIKYYGNDIISKDDLELGLSVAPTPAPVPSALVSVPASVSASAPVSTQLARLRTPALASPTQPAPAPAPAVKKLTSDKPSEYTDEQWKRMTPSQQWSASRKAKDASSGSAIKPIEPFSFQALYDAISHYN